MIKPQNDGPESPARAVELAHRHVVGLLAAHLAYEIRDILTALGTELALAAPTAWPPDVRAQMDRLFLLTHRLLALRRPSALHTEPLSLREILTDCLHLVRAQAHVDGIVIRLRVAGDLPPVRGDRARLEQLFITLLLNARDSMAYRGGRLSVTATAKGKWVQVNIRDTGATLSPERLIRLFDPLEGCGLGLWGAKEIAEEHHGRILARPNRGPGTCLSVRLPRADVK